MLAFVTSELEKLNIDLVSSISLSECEITRPYLLEKRGIEQGTVIIFAVPYFVNGDTSNSNISAYAISQDYHLFFSSLFEDLINKLSKKYPSNKFAGFTDQSPINEIKAAAKSGIASNGQIMRSATTTVLREIVPACVPLWLLLFSLRKRFLFLMSAYFIK